MEEGDVLLVVIECEKIESQARADSTMIDDSSNTTLFLQANIIIVNLLLFCAIENRGNPWLALQIKAHALSTPEMRAICVSTKTISFVGPTFFNSSSLSWYYGARVLERKRPTSVIVRPSFSRSQHLFLPSLQQTRTQGRNGLEQRSSRCFCELPRFRP
ncbi:hypothetical protein IQ06DRAFT_366750, partial [Phaeosphaeriaceae sp. SRC1lsM3a]